jgi:hypothetical protein
VARKQRARRKDAHPAIPKACAWCQGSFDVPYKDRNKTRRCCSKKCHGHWVALKRGAAAFRAQGKVGGKRSGQVRRQFAVNNFLKCVAGPMQSFATCLYLLGFMHGQNAVALKYQRALRARRSAA